MKEHLIAFDKDFSPKDIFGVADKNLRLLEKEFSVKISLKAEGINVKGAGLKVQEAVNFLDKMRQLGREGFVFSADDLRQYLNAQSAVRKGSAEDKESPGGKGVKVSSPRRKFIFAKTKGQQEYIDAMAGFDVVFSIGPAGTGKTYLAMAMAVNALMEKKVRRIILTRPAIEAGESLGFLPGDLRAKLAPYLRPLYDALYDMMDPDTAEGYIENGVIEVAPLAYMRGRTLNSAFVILDEAQNCTSEQLKMFLTRLGFYSQAVITGDITQSDLPGGKPSGLLDAVSILKDIKDIKFINLGRKDVVMHPLVQKIILAYEDSAGK